MERIKGQKSIERVFAIYIVCFCISTILLAAAAFVSFGYMIQYGIILRADYYEKYIEQRRSIIAEAEEVKTIIPDECKYAVFDMNGKMLQGNVDNRKALNMWEVYRNNNTIDGKYFYKFIQRENEICVVEYMIVAKFSNPILQKYIPNAESCFFILIIIIFIIEVIIFSKCFRRRLMREMKLLKDTTENVQMENLVFEVGKSNIIEINDVLSALDKMKKQLQLSLNKQWKLEQARKEQIAALAHDIKTPLTILQGNAELMEEMDLNSEQKVFLNNILNESNKIETYIRALLEIMKSEKEITIKKKQIEAESFIEDITEAAKALTLNKGIDFETEVFKIPEVFLGDKDALERALMNVISNAVDFSPAGSKILFQVLTKRENIIFIVEDTGRGFTKEELNYAAEQFFQGDKSRNSKNHYGIGLYIAKEFLNQHNGKLKLENSEKTGGARVSLEIPIK